jgi:hypothetical protein
MQYHAILIDSRVDLRTESNPIDRKFSCHCFARSSKIQRNNPIVRKSLTHMARKQPSENPLVVSSGAAAAPVRRKTTASKRTVTPAVAVEVDAVAAAPTPAAVVKPTNEQIAALAYSFWEARGYQGGSEEEDWLRAEKQLSASSAK